MTDHIDLIPVIVEREHAVLPDRRPRSVSPASWILAHCERRPDGCLVWTRAGSPAGYGQARVDGRLMAVHRIVWEAEHGPIPDGLMLDHLCWNRRCVNTSHLRLVTNMQNCWNRDPRRASGEARTLGVHRSHGAWHVQLKRAGHTYYGGRFHDVHEAITAANRLRAHLDTTGAIL